MSVQIRKAQPQEAAQIARFNAELARETEGKTLDPKTLERGVVRLMDRPEYGQYFVAEVDGTVIACLMVTYEWSDWRDGLVWWIQSVYVHQDWRRQGVYQDMYRYLQQLVKTEPDVIGFRLYVDKDNRRAQAVYKNLGMQATDYLMFEAF